MERDFEVGGRKFKLLKVDAFKQFHIVRRMGPILADLIPSMKEIAAGTKKNIEELSESEKFEQIGKFAGPIMTGLSKLSDADSEHVLYGLLNAVEMQQVTGNWVRVVQGTPPILMVQDMDFPILMQLAGRAFVFNLSSFFSALPHQ